MTLFDALPPMAAVAGPDPDGAASGGLGEVFTARWVVELLLDLVGYRSDRDLAGLRLVDPACGSGAFAGAAVERLSRSCRERGRPLRDAVGAIRAFDLQPRHAAASRALVYEVLLRDGWPGADAEEFAASCVRRGDYLLAGEEGSADMVVGNPPYVRLEDVPAGRMRAYRAACPTMIGRADVYVGFYERALRSLKPGGVLGFICSDRWMRNQYGRALRQLVGSSFAVDAVITMHDVAAFDTQVSAYPAVTLLRRGPQRRVVVADADRTFGVDAARNLGAWIVSGPSEQLTVPGIRAARLPHWFSGEDSWPSGSPARLAMIETLNDGFRPLQDPATRTRVGIGVATGADAVFVTRDDTLVEPDRLLPLSMVRDTVSGRLDWSGHYLVNPWASDGSLVDLDDYPLLRRYLRRHQPVLAGRHIATRRPWYQTIDKVDHSLLTRPKLLFPDLKLTISPVLDPGGLYPHHNLYYVVSRRWDPRVLGGLLLSGVADAFVAAYAVRMRGGTLRFQAQYLRRIRVPDPDSVAATDNAALATAFEARDRDAATAIALRLYGLEDLPL